jgi:WD40 repeat protein
LLSSGKVLVVGGSGTDGGNGYLDSAALYDPVSGTWAATGTLASPHYDHTATLLPDGKVLVAGGWDGTGNTGIAELYDPASGTWTEIDSLATARRGHTATLLTDGKVLVAAGQGSGITALASAELYDPASGTWSATGSLVIGRIIATANLLPIGKVLVTGGQVSTPDATATAELYDPASGTWTLTGRLSINRVNHTATLLPNGKVLVAGGQPNKSAELYDALSGTWTATGGPFSHNDASATLLPDGRVLVVGGINNANADLYDVGLGFSSECQPDIDRTPLPLRSGTRLRLAGSLFQGISQASGGNTQDSSSNYPIVQLRRLDNDQVTFLSVDPRRDWSDTSFTSLPVKGFPAGPAQVTVFTNGIPSVAKTLVVTDRQ